MHYPGSFARTRPDHPAVIMAESGRVVTYRELVRITARALGRPARQLHVPRPLTRAGAGAAAAIFTAAGRPVPGRLAALRHPVISRVVSIDKARRFGVSATPLEAAMSATVEQMSAFARS